MGLTTKDKRLKTKDERKGLATWNQQLETIELPARENLLISNIPASQQAGLIGVPYSKYFTIFRLPEVGDPFALLQPPQGYGRQAG